LDLLCVARSASGDAAARPSFWLLELRDELPVLKSRLLTALAALTLACSGGAPRDSDVVEWSVNPTPLTAIATDDSLETIGNAVGIARLDNGQVVVADQSSSIIRFYGPDGKFLKKVGRKGGGPGEFEMLGEMLHCGDTLYAHDFSNKAFTLISADGTFGRRVSVALPDSVRSTFRSVCNASGKLLTAGWDFESAAEEKTGPTRGLIPYWISDAQGKVSASLGMEQSSEKWLSVLPSGIVIVGPRPLGRETVMALGTSRAYIGTADSGVINVYALDGKRLPPLRIATANEPVTIAHIDEFKLRDTLFAPPGSREMWIETMKQMKFPATMPAYTALFVDSSEHVWVRGVPTPGSAEVGWTVFSGEGERVANIKLPTALSVAEVGGDYVAGVQSDATTGEQRVVVLSLVRAKH
jgi:hypothetical protein